MPGFKSHYLFGHNALNTFTPNQHEQFLHRYPQSYNIGLQGPDVFFYYLPAWLFYKHNIGNVIHSNEVHDFFHALIDARNSLLKKEHRLIADAYISGFIAHYTLDCIVHPYIYYRTKNKEHEDDKLYDFGIHVFLETDIDNALLRHYTHIKPSEFAMGDTIKLSVQEHLVISLLLYKAIKQTYPENKVLLYVIRHALTTMSVEANLMKDPTGIKKKVVRFLERLATGHAVISGMIPNDKVTTYKDPCNLGHKKWYNPWKEEDVHTESIYDLIDKANPILEERIHYYSKAHTLSRELSPEEKSENLKALYKSLGNKSYLTGLEL
ncbi:MAG: zinc dependent phospholipase C family protein [Lachnospiraceae bacterium]|nr:zinc dependent phospholipase C family protein [Lachnospiraceae bacterium]